MNVSVVGIGAVGNALTRVLSKTHKDVIAYNRTAQKLSPFKEMGIQTTTNIHDALGPNRIVFCCLPNYDAFLDLFQDVLIDETTIVVSCATLVPSQSEMLNKKFSTFVEATILGTPPLIENGSARMYIASDDKHASATTLNILSKQIKCIQFGCVPKATQMKTALQSYNASFLMGVFQFSNMTTQMGFTSKEVMDAVAGMPYWARYGDSLLEKIQSGDTSARVSCAVAVKSFEATILTMEQVEMDTTHMKCILKIFQSAAEKWPDDDITMVVREF